MPDKVKFKPTRAMTAMVEDAAAGSKKFELMATFVPEGDMWCLSEVEGNAMPGYEDEGGDKPKDKMDGGKFGAAYKEQMGPPQQGGGGY